MAAHKILIFLAAFVTLWGLFYIFRTRNISPTDITDWLPFTISYNDGNLSVSRSPKPKLNQWQQYLKHCFETSDDNYSPVLFRCPSESIRPFLPEALQESCPFFNKLPGELRNIIYCYLLVTQEIISSPHLLLSTGEQIMLNYCRRRLDLAPVILRVCQKTNHEAIEILYGRNTFQFTSVSGVGSFFNSDLIRIFDGRSYLQTFNLHVHPAGRFAYVRHLELRLVSQDLYPSVGEPRTNHQSRQHPPSVYIKEWAQLLGPTLLARPKCGASFPALESLTIDLSDWQLPASKRLNVRPFVRIFGCSGGLRKLFVRGVENLWTLDQLGNAVVKEGGTFKALP